MKNSNQNKLQFITGLIFNIIVFSIFGWIYFIGIVSPNFESPFGLIYRGIGCGMVYPLYSLLIPTYMNKYFSEIRYSGVIVSVASFIITLILLITTFPSYIK